MALSALTTGQNERNHPSVVTFSWSDNGAGAHPGGRLAQGLQAGRLRRADHLLGRVQQQPAAGHVR